MGKADTDILTDNSTAENFIDFFTDYSILSFTYYTEIISFFLDDVN